MSNQIKGSPDIVFLLSGLYFFVVGIWWTVQTSKKYFFCTQHKLEFTSTLTFSCGPTCSNVPVESIIKLVTCLGLLVYCIASIHFRLSITSEEYEKLSHATVFTFFLFSNIVDVIKHFKKNRLIHGFDYAILVLCHAIQAVIYGSHGHDMFPEIWIAHSLRMISSTACSFAVLHELIKPNTIASPMLRSISTLTLGSWLIQSFFLTVDGIADSDIEQNNRVIVISLYFTWHLGSNMILCGCVWLFTHKMLASNRCCCIPNDFDATGEDVYLQNRIRFDYHVMDRLEYELD